jgi:hypothetical protein
VGWVVSCRTVVEGGRRRVTLQLGVLLLVLAPVVQQQIQQLTRVGSCG